MLKLPPPRFFGLVSLFLLLSCFLVPKESRADDSLIGQSAAIVLAVVQDIDPDAYNEKLDMAYTAVRVIVKNVLWGTVPASDMVFTIPGGNYPDGSMGGYADQAELTAGKDYLLFLQAAPWLDSPFVGAHLGVFALEKFPNKVLLVDQQGHVVTGFTPLGPEIGEVVAPPADILAMEGTPSYDWIGVEVSEEGGMGELCMSAKEFKLFRYDLGMAVYQNYDGVDTVLSDLVSLLPSTPPEGSISLVAENNGILTADEDKDPDAITDPKEIQKWIAQLQQMYPSTVYVEDEKLENNLPDFDSPAYDTKPTEEEEGE